MSSEIQRSIVTQEQHKEVLESINKLEVALVRIDDRITHHMIAEHKDFDALIDVIKGGKLAAKIIGIVIAGVVALATTFEWIRHNFHIFPK